MIAKLFDRRFWKYFFITLVAVQFIFALNVPFRYLEQLLEQHTTPGDTCLLSLLVAAGLLTESVCIAASYASFFAFRRLPGITEMRGFFSALTIGFLCFIPLAVGIYLYDLHVQPRVKAQSAALIWKMRTNGESDHDFLNSTPGLSTAKVLSEEIQSLQHQIEHTSQSDFTYSDMADRLIKYRVELASRWVMAINLMLSFLLFASVGYFSRNQTIKRILGVLAVIIVAALLISSAKNRAKQYMTHLQKEVREVR